MIADIISRLESMKTPLGLALVSGAASFQKAVESNPAAVPAVYVFTLDESAGTNPVAPDVHQRVGINIGVVLVVRNVADTKGAVATQDMDALRNAVKAVLMGWVPAAGYDALERGRSHLLAFRDGYMWWQDGYTTAFYDRSQL